MIQMGDGMACFERVMDKGIDAMPSWTMGLPSNHGTTPPAAPTNTSNAYRMMMGPYGVTGKWWLQLIMQQHRPKNVAEICGCTMTLHSSAPQTTRTHNATARVDLEKQATINRRVEAGCSWRLLQTKHICHPTLLRRQRRLDTPAAFVIPKQWQWPQKQWTSFTDIPTAFQPRGVANLMAAITVHCPTEYAGDGRMQSNAPPRPPLQLLS